jgi:phosphonate transport system substrate-binding protein
MLTTLHQCKLRYFNILFVCISLLIMSACDNHGVSDVSIDTLSIGVLPDQDVETVRVQYQPLIDYLQKSTDIKCQLITPSSYSELLEWFHSGKINMALFGGYTFIKALNRDEAIPIAMRDIDERFTSVVIANKDLNIMSLSELNGLTFSFGSKLSTSGHLMPRYFFEKENIIAEDFFSALTYSGTHDKTAELVRKGKIDAGVANAYIIKEMFSNGTLNTTDVNIIWESPPYPDYVWAVSKKIDDETQIKILDAFLSLSSENHSHKNILEQLDANHFIPADKVEFKILEQIVNSLESTS